VREVEQNIICRVEAGEGVHCVVASQWIDIVVLVAGFEDYFLRADLALEV
jgi:hypothetical protein